MTATAWPLKNQISFILYRVFFQMKLCVGLLLYFIITYVSVVDISAKLFVFTSYTLSKFILRVYTETHSSFSKVHAQAIKRGRFHQKKTSRLSDVKMFFNLNALNKTNHVRIIDPCCCCSCMHRLLQKQRGNLFLG